MRIYKVGRFSAGCIAFVYLGFALGCLGAQLSESSLSTVRLAARPVVDAYFLPSGYGLIVASDGNREFLFTTLDNGDHWSKEPLNVPIAAISFLNEKRGFGVVIAGREFSLVETKNGGQNWRHVCAIPELSRDTTVLTSVVLSGSNTAWILGSQPGGLTTVLKIDTTKCIVKKPFPPSSSSGLLRAMFEDKKSGELWLVGNDSVVYSRDLGNSWKPQVNRNTLREGTSFTSGVALGNGTALVVGASAEATVYRTIDHGLHWDLVAKSPESHWFKDIYFWDLAHGCAVGASTTLFCTGDGGSTWEARNVLPRFNESSLPTDIVFIKIAFVNGGRRGWAVANGGLIFQTDDAGNSWHPLDLFSVTQP